MPYPDLPFDLPFSIVIDDSFAAALFGLSTLIFVFLIVWAIIKKISGNEALKYEFITIIAHKFRTPLTTVKWSADELAKNEQDPYKKQSLQGIQESNEKLIKLTGTLIELTDTDSRAASSYAFERVSLCGFMRAVGESFKTAFHEKNISFSVQCSTDDVYVSIDRERIEFVLQMLLENALSYTPIGKRVEVSVGISGKKALVAVTDSGIGIDKKDMPSVFTKFFRAENARSADTEGFGVGLYLAQAIARRHKGVIGAYSDGPGAGSTFTLALPAIR